MNAKRIPRRFRQGVERWTTMYGRARRRRPRIRRRPSDAASSSPTVGSTDRLVPSPIFVLSSVRSGSTLLRVILDSHPDIYAPAEMHLRTLKVQFGAPFTAKAMDQLGLTADDLQDLLWDRILHRELALSGRAHIVDKTPANSLVWRRINAVWPDARYVFLLRHPGAIYTSIMNRRADGDVETAISEISRYVDHIEQARAALPGITIKYEDLTSDPERVTRQICRHLGVRWQREMLDYGSVDHGPFKPFLGDWSDKIRSGRIEPARTVASPSDYPRALDRFVRTWGYETRSPGILAIVDAARGTEPSGAH